MILDTFTLDELDQRLRVDASVQLLAGRPPEPKVVLFDRQGAVLEAVPRPPKGEERTLDTVLDVLLLGRLLRPRVVALAVPTLPPRHLVDTHSCELWLAVAERQLTGLRVRTWSYLVPRSGPDELPQLDGPRPVPTPAELLMMVRAATARGPRRLRRRIGMIAALLRSDGHDLRVSDRLQARFERVPLDLRPAR